MKILIVVDVQNDFIDGTLGSADALATIPAISQKIAEYAKDPDNIIFFTQDTHWEDYDDTAEGNHLPVKHCVYGTEGWKIPKYIMPEDGFKCSHFNIQKPTFGYVNWDDEFDIPNRHEIESIELIGFCTDICVVSNALIVQAIARSEFEFPPTVICDGSCCAGATMEGHWSALEVMKACQIEVINE